MAMNPNPQLAAILSRRHFLTQSACGLGVAALAALLSEDAAAAEATGGLADFPQFTPKAKRVIYLFQSGAPSQIDLFDYKPRLKEFHASELADSVSMGRRLSGMASRQRRFTIAAWTLRYVQHVQ